MSDMSDINAFSFKNKAKKKKVLCQMCFRFEAYMDLTDCATGSAVNRGKSLYEKSHLCSL